MQEIINWIMEGPAWIQYRCLLDLLDSDQNGKRVVSAKAAMLSDPQVTQLISDVDHWETSLLKRHNDADHPIHKLCFLAELGLTIHDQGMDRITGMVLSHQSAEGPFQVLSNYPTNFGGSGKDEWLWSLCDAPPIIYALIKMGLRNDPAVNKALDYLSALIMPGGGWPCAAATALSNFRGPGKKIDPCPYANLIMLKTLIERDDPKDKGKISSGARAALSLWENSLNQRPYLFKMGTDFRKLKAPFVWYDILHLAQVLSLIPSIQQEQSFQEILNVIRVKADGNQRYTSESIWTKWAGWEFCQKREPSRWITLIVLRIFKQAGALTLG
jgi:hypothetical protein